MSRRHAPAELRSVLIMGFGNIGQALSPLLRQRFAQVPVHVIDDRMTPEQVTVAQAHGFSWQQACIEAHNHEALLAPWVAEGTLVLNLATSIDSLTVLTWAQARGAWYLDTCIDPWAYQDGALADAQNTNYRMRAAVIGRQQAQRATGQRLPTAVVAHGANPGMVSIFVKEALLHMAQRHLPVRAAPVGRREWALLADALGVRVIQVSERDTQFSLQPRAEGEFQNTWSVDGFVAEALQPVEMGWGTHEAHGPWALRVRGHAHGDRSGVYAEQLGVHTRVRTCTPLAGEVRGWLISHNEAFSIAAWLTLQQGEQVSYRPTVYYAYHPCDQAADSLQLLADGSRQAVAHTRVLKDELVGGIDELGVLLLSDRHPACWYGSQLSLARARELAPHNNATSLQVVGSIMGALQWLLQHPMAGIVESEDLDHTVLMQHAAPYWEPLVVRHFDWHPMGARAADGAARWCLDQFLD
jgi:homospermidine synthase